MNNQFERTELLLGEESLKTLQSAHIAVFGVGGVGGYVIEALARSSIQNLDIIDRDTVSISNINRQIIALNSTVGRYKVDVMKERILDINPNANVNTFNLFYLSETKNLFDFSKYDYVIDAVDTVTAKLQLIQQSKEAGVPIISSMGAGNKLNPTMFEVADISKTSVCPLARIMRSECKKRGIKNVKVVYSKEKPVSLIKKVFDKEANKVVPGSISFVPSTVGLIIASEVIKDLCRINKTNI